MNTIQVLVDGKELISVPVGTDAETILHQSGLSSQWGTAALPFAPVAVLVQHELAALSASIYANCELSPVYPDTPLGAEVYRHSLCFLLAMAARTIVPERRLTVSMAINNGYYHYFDDEDPVSNELLTVLARRCVATLLKTSQFKLYSIHGMRPLLILRKRIRPILWT